MFLRDKLKRRKLNPKAEKFSTPSMLKEPSTSENYYNELAEQDENMDEGEQSATSEAPNPANSTKQILKGILRIEAIALIKIVYTAQLTIVEKT
ncbi:unnamed protein product [Hermetia illucens]|uniref:Uncharacterized protein n=1 Tax=Hermetia illucens TaxID=343691 RepID=A0A7R8Z154_HERIL|nr:unnamed protein product [Hermetia illucens]